MGSSSIHIELAQILTGIKRLGDNSFSWRGEPEVNTTRFPKSIPIAGTLNHPLPDDDMTRTLQAVLYHRSYCHHFASAPIPNVNYMETPPKFISDLSEANTGVDQWDLGWRVYLVGADGSIHASKGDRQLRAQAGEYATEAVSFRPVVGGEAVRLRVAKESLAIQPGFFFFFGRMLGDSWDEHWTIRFYFNSESASVPAVIRFLTAEMNRYQVPFRMKTLTNPDAYTRSDSTVLFVARRYCSIVSRIIRQMPSDLAERLRPRIPLFTRHVRDGVGMSEDPGTGESFGMHRCRLVAEGILDAWRLYRYDLASLSRAVGKRFLEASIDINHPHIRQGFLELPVT